MKFFGAILFFLLTCLGISAGQSDYPQDTLEQAQWKHRIIITCSQAHSADVSSFGIKYLEQIDRRGFVDRDIMLLHVLPKPREGVLAITETPAPKIWLIDDWQEVQDIKEKARCARDTNSIALIGKDGGLKKSWTQSRPSNAELFALIDAMPMRQQEMR